MCVAQIKAYYRANESWCQSILGMEIVKEGVIQITAGGCAGFVEVCVMHPLDLVKTRFQIQQRGSAEAYKSLADCFAKIYRSEG